MGEPPTLTVVQSCVDTRLLRIHGELGRHFDEPYLFASPGGADAVNQDAQELKALINGVGRLWRAKGRAPKVRFVLITHEDCAAMGGSAAFDGSIEQELRGHWVRHMEAANALHTTMNTGRYTSDLNPVDVEFVHGFMMLSGRMIRGRYNIGFPIEHAGTYTPEPVGLEDMLDRQVRGTPVIPDRVRI